eukprot:6486451-Amphidinium_carterae.1
MLGPWEAYHIVVFLGGGGFSARDVGAAYPFDVVEAHIQHRTEVTHLYPQNSGTSFIRVSKEPGNAVHWIRKWKNWF